MLLMVVMLATTLTWHKFGFVVVGVLYVNLDVYASGFDPGQVRLRRLPDPDPEVHRPGLLPVQRRSGFERQRAGHRVNFEQAGAVIFEQVGEHTAGSLSGTK